jgi:hypothetical protein
MQTCRIVEAGPGDLPDVAALFRAYAAELPVDLALQGFELDSPDCRATTRRLKARC